MSEEVVTTRLLVGRGVREQALAHREIFRRNQFGRHAAAFNMDVDGTETWECAIAFRAFVLLVSDWRSNALLAHRFGDQRKFLAGEVNECEIFEALRYVRSFMTGATFVCVQRLVTLEHDFAVPAFGLHGRMFFVHVRFQTEHIREIIAHADRATEALGRRSCRLVVVLNVVVVVDCFEASLQTGRGVIVVDDFSFTIDQAVVGMRAATTGIG